MKYPKILAALLTLALLAGCGTAGDADPTKNPEPAATPAQTEPAQTEPAETETPAPPEGTETPAETPVPEETPAPDDGDREPDEVWTYSDHFCGDGPLQAWDGYGALLPYTGAVAQSDEMYMNPNLPEFGLCTSQGQLVTEPIYSEVRYGDGFLMLMQQEGSNTYTTVAAQDGSWVGEKTLLRYVDTFGDIAVLMDTEGGLYCWNSQGEQFQTFPGSLFTPILGDIFDTYDWTFSPTLIGVQDHILYANSYVQGEDFLDTPIWLYLDLDTGAVLETPPEGYPETLAPMGEVTRPLPNGTDGFEFQDPFTGELYYKTYVDLGVQVYDSHDTLIMPEDTTSSTYLDCPVMDGLVAVQSPYAKEGAYDIVFDWIDVNTWDVVFRYAPEWRYQ